MALAPNLAPAPSPAWRIEQRDCLDLLRSLPDASVDCIVTDPAYSGMNEHMAFGRGRIVGRYGAPDNHRWFTEFRDDPESFRALLDECHRVLRPDRHIYVMFDSFSLLSLGALMRERFKVKGVVVWDKSHIGMGHYFRRQHELIVFACKGHRRLSRRDLPDVWRIRRIHRGAYPTQKPVAVFTRMLEGSVEAGMTVCDPFVGSGSSGMAALAAGCHFIGADVNADAVAMATRRLASWDDSGEDFLER
jgi:site-specific DNA-methyltransferase (adenine-specific)